MKADDPKYFEHVSKIKNEMTAESLCMGQAKGLRPFVREIFSYGYLETPNYSKLKHLLASFLMEHSVCPDDIFDWSKFAKNKLGEVKKN
jgi:hypothetical protein